MPAGSTWSIRYHRIINPRRSSKSAETFSTRLFTVRVNVTSKALGYQPERKHCKNGNIVRSNIAVYWEHKTCKVNVSENTVSQSNLNTNPTKPNNDLTVSEVSLIGSGFLHLLTHLG